MKLLRLQDGDAPVLLDSFREEGTIAFCSMGAHLKSLRRFFSFVRDSFN